MTTESIFRLLYKKLENELIQLYEEGYLTRPLEIDFERVKPKPPFDKAKSLKNIYNKISNLKKAKSFKYHEYDDFENIFKTQPSFAKPLKNLKDEKFVKDAILGAWQGRIVGTMLGKPVLGWSAQDISKFLTHLKIYPLKNYFPPVKRAVRGLRYSDPLAVNGQKNSLIDENLNYTLISLIVLEERGHDFKTEDIANEWLKRLPCFYMRHAELSGFNNYIDGIDIPMTAKHWNPFREWAGAASRIDMWAWTNIGRPLDAINMAFRDSRFSHTKNGIYASLFVSALISNALSYDNIIDLIQNSLNAVPKSSRLYDIIHQMLFLKLYEREFNEAILISQKLTKEYHWAHSIPFTTNVVLGLMHSKDSAEEAITRGVMTGGYTTGVGGAIGSIMGVRHGTKAFSQKWTSPFHDKISSSVSGHYECKISELAKRTAKLYK